MPETHVLVGGLGFLGANLVEELVGRGHRVVVVARRSSVGRRQWLRRVIESLGATVHVAEGRVEAPDIARFSPDVVYHLAGKPGGPRSVQWEAHVGLLEREMEAAEETGARIVYVSSIAVVADASPLPPGSLVVEEEEHLWGRRGVFQTHHSETKAEGERRLVSWRGRWAILRPGLVYGRHAYHREWRLARTLARLRLAPVVAGAPVVGVHDVARIAAMAGEGSLDGRWVNVVSPFTHERVAVEFCRRASGSRRCLRIPQGPLLRLGRLAGRGSTLRLAWSIVSRRYRYRSRILEGYEWRLEPIL